MKTSELTGAALDWAVAKCADLPFPIVYDEDGRTVKVSPSTDWSQGGPIIERERVELTLGSGWWRASMEYTNDDSHRPQFSEEDGPTPLIAAMRCYVASKLGDEIELPEELV